MAKFIDLTGQIFGRLTVVDRAENTPKGDARWNCSCECGSKTTVRADHLKNGRIKSCKCLMLETTAMIGTSNTTHGASVRRSHKQWNEIAYEYRVWLSVKDRVKSDPRYKDRDMCSEWLNSYETFLKDMGKAPSNKHQIDRIDNSKGYYPSNCRWATPSENMRNTSANKLVEWRGEVRCLAEWGDILCPQLNLNPITLRSRLSRNWSVEKAFTTPNPPNRLTRVANGR
jgi:hypothetical protein